MAQRTSPARKATPLGVQASDLSKAMRNETEGYLQQPRAVRPREMIESMRVVGKDRLTARDHALYEGLVARAQEAGIAAPAHTVPLADLMRYLGTDEIGRLKDSFERLAGTTVTYSSNDGTREKCGWLHLLTEIHLDHHRRSPEKSTVTYTLPATVRQMLAEPSSYAKVELLAYPGFTCRYTPRLYPRLALRAGYSHEVAGFGMPLKWEVEPKALAEEIGYPTDPFRFANFERDCLGPVMDDIKGNVRRFTASCELKRGSGRGRPVEAVVFKFTKARSLLAESQRRDLTSEQKARIAAPDHEHDASELPSDVVIAKACSMLRRDSDEISLGYRHALSRAKADPSAALGHGVMGGDLLWARTNLGADGAFEIWANAQTPGKEIPSPDRPSPGPAAKAPAAAAAVEKAAPVAVPSDDDWMRQSAQYLVHHLDGWVGDPARGIRSPWTDDVIRHQAAMDVSPFSSFKDHPTISSRLSSALAVVRQTSPQHRRTSLRALAQAIVDMDSAKLLRAAGAIIGAGAQAAEAARPAPAVRQLNRIREVNELTAGFEGDPLFALDHDDRDASDDEYEAEQALRPAFDPFEHPDDDLPVSVPDDEGYIMPVEED